MLSMCGNWLLVGWTCAKIGYLLVEHVRKLVPRWLSMCENHLAHHVHLQNFPLFPFYPFLCPLLLSLSNVLCPLSHVFVLCLPSYLPFLCLCSICSMSPFICPLSHVSVPCLPSAVPSLTSLFLVSRPPSPHGSAPCLLSSAEPCVTWSVTCLPSSFLRPLTPINCPSVPFLWLYSTVPVLCSSFYRPLFLQLLSSASCHSYYENASFSLKIHMHTNVVDAFDGWLRAGTVLVCLASG